MRYTVVMDEKRPTKHSSRLTVSLLIFLVLYSFFSFRKINQRLDSLNQTQTKEVRVAESNVLGATASVTVPGYTDTSGGAASSVIDASPATWWYAPTGKDPVSLTLKLSGQCQWVNLISLLSMVDKELTILFSSKVGIPG